MNRIVELTGDYLIKKPPKGFVFDRPAPYINGKFFYVWHDDHIVKSRFLSYCTNKYAFRIATLKEDCFGKP